MKAKIMTWDEFREVCREDAHNWYHSGWESDMITADDILNEYPEGYFSDDTDDDYDDLSSAFTPAEFAAKTLEYLEEIEEEDAERRLSGR